MLDVPLDHRVTALVRRSTGTGLRSLRNYSRGNTGGAPVVWASGDGTPEPFQEDDSMTASIIALLLGNGYMRMRAETALRQGCAAGWGRFRRTSAQASFCGWSSCWP